MYFPLHVGPFSLAHDEMDSTAPTLNGCLGTQTRNTLSKILQYLYHHVCSGQIYDEISLTFQPGRRQATFSSITTFTLTILLMLHGNSVKLLTGASLFYPIFPLFHPDSLARQQPSGARRGCRRAVSCSFACVNQSTDCDFTIHLGLAFASPHARSPSFRMGRSTSRSQSLFAMRMSLSSNLPVATSTIT